MKILFVMKHRGNAGNTHAVADYTRIGQKHGHEIALFGPSQPWLPDLRFSMDVGAFDKVVYLFESELYRVSRLHEASLLATMPRQSRVVFDMDGMYNPLIVLNGYDRNHTGEAERQEWVAFYKALSDRVVKPTMAEHDQPDVVALPIYGYDPALQLDPASASEKTYDILHVGHNWWRWREISERLLPALEPIRNKLGDIGFVGLWWDGPPAEGREAGPAEAFQSDPDLLRRLRIQTRPAVMFDEVIRTMSTARINIFTQRPILHHLRHLTLKYFEIFYADTIPLLMLDPDHAAEVYGPAALELVLSGDIAAKILDALDRPEYYRGVVEDVRSHLSAHHSYDTRLEELIALFRSK